jgi:autotransporter translocation and assembly factor TamB
VTYDFNRIGKGGLPLGRAQIQLAQVVAGAIHLRSFDSATQITRQNPPALTLALRVIDAQGNTHSADATLAAQNGNVTGALTQLTLVASDGQWHLGAPASFVAGPRLVSIGAFEMRNGSRELTLSATTRIAGAQNISLRARNLDLGLIKPLLQPNQHPAGTLAADIAITGSAAAPLIRASLVGNGLAIDSQRIGDLTLHSDYELGTTSVNLALYQDAPIS